MVKSWHGSVWLLASPEASCCTTLCAAIAPYTAANKNGCCLETPSRVSGEGLSQLTCISCCSFYVSEQILRRILTQNLMHIHTRLKELTNQKRYTLLNRSGRRERERARLGCATVCVCHSMVCECVCVLSISYIRSRGFWTHVCILMDSFTFMVYCRVSEFVLRNKASLECCMQWIYEYWVGPPLDKGVLTGSQISSRKLA